MPRLSPEQWEQARAEYEVRGISLGEVARKFGVDTAAVSRMAKKEAWQKGKSQGLVDRKVAAVKEMAAIRAESQGLPLTYRHTLETVARERLEAEGILAEADSALGRKVIEFAQKVQTPEELEVVARARKHLAPQMPKTETKVTVNNQQAQAIQPLSPKQVLEELAKKAGNAPDA